VTRDLGADHAGRIGIVLGAADAADRVSVKDLDLERAGRGAVVRTGRSNDAGADGLVHRLSYLSAAGVARTIAYGGQEATYGIGLPHLCAGSLTCLASRSRSSVLRILP